MVNHIARSGETLLRWFLQPSRLKIPRTCVWRLAYHEYLRVGKTTQDVHKSRRERYRTLGYCVGKEQVQSKKCRVDVFFFINWIPQSVVDLSYLQRGCNKKWCVETQGQIFQIRNIFIQTLNWTFYICILVVGEMNPIRKSNLHSGKPACVSFYRSGSQKCNFSYDLQVWLSLCKFIISTIQPCLVLTHKLFTPLHRIFEHMHEAVRLSPTGEASHYSYTKCIVQR